MMGWGSLSLLAVLALFIFCHAHRHVVWFSRTTILIHCCRVHSERLGYGILPPFTSFG